MSLAIHASMATQLSNAFRSIAMAIVDKTRMKKASSLLCCAAVAGCASHADSIEASYVSQSQYADMSCEQLLKERQGVRDEVRRVAGLQDENADADVVLMSVGLILFWPALFGLAATKDREDELGRLKGQYEAIEDTLDEKDCPEVEDGVQEAVVRSSDRPASQFRGATSYDVEVTWSEHGEFSGIVKDFAYDDDTGTFLVNTADPQLACQGQWKKVAAGKPNRSLSRGTWTMDCEGKPQVSAYYAVSESGIVEVQGSDDNGNFVGMTLTPKGWVDPDAGRQVASTPNPAAKWDGQWVGEAGGWKIDMMIDRGRVSGSARNNTNCRPCVLTGKIDAYGNVTATIPASYTHDVSRVTGKMPKLSIEARWPPSQEEVAFEQAAAN
ncbi:MAG: hypothetical protein R3316_11150 [Rhodovibrionaceae bacterium]|nr:hypothetical protein [Rhodovibrionaceae bacterium]